MWKLARALLVISQFCAVCAVLAGVFAGLLTVFAASFTCFDSCPPPDEYFARFLPGTQYVLIPCIALEALALVTFVTYCVATNQSARAIKQSVAFLALAPVGIAALDAVFRLCQSTLPVTEYGLVPETPAVTWLRWWGLTVAIVAGVWAGVLAWLQWGRGAQQNQTTSV